MKKLIAVAFLSLHLFTAGGHVLLYQYAVYKSDKLFNDQISRGRYNVDDLVEIKVPAHTTLKRNWTAFEPIHGQVQFKSTCYNYVKLRLSPDTVYLMCIPNYEKTRLFNENIISAKDLGDIPVNKKDHVPFGKTPDLGKYNYPLMLHRFTPPVIVLPAAGHSLYCYTVNTDIDIPEQPPKFLI